MKADVIAAALALLIREADDLTPIARAALVGAMEQVEAEVLPWEPEILDVPEVPSTWSEVHPGDHVQAPNGEWYKVDAWSRTGEAVKVLLIVNGATVPTTQPAGVKVMARRTSAEGRARDMFAAAGIELERI